MIEVTKNENGSFTISWDEDSPAESILNTWTEEEFVKVIMEYLQKLNKNERTDKTHFSTSAN
jgi:hypothetical protein